MPTPKTVWGIDVGQCALKALKLRYRDERLQAVSFDVIEHAKILSQPDADEQQLIRSALGKFVSRNSIKGSTLVVSVPGQASFTRFIKLPPVESKKIPEIVRYEARQQIPFNLEDVVWDYQAMGAGGAGPREVEVGIFAMKRDIVADYVSDFLAMRIEPDIVQMAPVALYNFLRYDKREGAGATVLADVGAENTNLVITEGDRVWIRPVPIGGNNFTQALSKTFKLPFAKAEKLKRHAAESKHARKVFQAMRPVFGDLLTEVQRSIGYYTSLHRDSRIERVVALGNAFRLPGLRKFLAQNLGVEVEKVEGFTSLQGAEALGAPLFRENVLSFGVAFGLAIQGLGVAAIRTSLLPPEILSAKVLRRKRPYFVAAAACVLGAVIAFGYDAVKTHGELEPKPGAVDRQVEAVNRLVAENAQQKKAFEAQRQALEKATARLEDLGVLTAGQDYIGRLYRAVWDALPPQGAPAVSVHDLRKVRAAQEFIELVNLSAHHVPDVRQYSASLGPSGTIKPGTDIVVVPPGEEEAAGGMDDGRMVPPDAKPPPAKPAAPAAGGPVPGILVRIVGITPRPDQLGHALVNSTLIQRLREDPRTVHLRTPAGPEVLARVRLTGRYGSLPDYLVYEGPPPGPGAGGAPPPEMLVDKREDFWFEAQWVVRVP